MTNTDIRELTVPVNDVLDYAYNAGFNDCAEMQSNKPVLEKKITGLKAARKRVSIVILSYIHSEIAKAITAAKAEGQREMAEKVKQNLIGSHTAAQTIIIDELLSEL